MRKDLMLITIIVATLTLMVIPINQRIMDVLLAANMSLSVILLMVSIYIKNPADFSTFPSVILIGTAFRLALSVGTTRLILADGDAGAIIETFGDFVVSGSIGIGLVIFLIITVVQFLVVTKGAERVAEVGARFALDALPGKQMTIDAEMRAGNISPEDATRKRKLLDKESQFFGAMDGAMKFVKGDAIAGLIIISINLIGGVAVGVSSHGYTFSESVAVFSILTVGDGLVAQIPALLMSLCAGMIVTRAANTDNDDLGSDIFGELVSDPRVPSMASIIVFSIGLIPGFPTFVFAFLAALLFGSSVMLRRRLLADVESLEAAARGEDLGAGAEEPKDEKPPLPVSDRFFVMLGSALYDSLDITEIRKLLTDHFLMLYSIRGVQFAVPPIQRSEHINARELIFILDEVILFKSDIPAESAFISDTGLVKGNDVFDPSSIVEFSCEMLHGFWVPASSIKQPEAIGTNSARVEEIVALLAYRFYEKDIGSLFSMSVFRNYLEEANKVDPETLALVKNEMSEAAFYKMLRYLVEDGVPMRPITLLFSSLYYWMHSVQGATSIVLAECLRGSMKRQLCNSIAGSDRMIGLALIDPSLELVARAAVAENQRVSGETVNDSLAFSSEVQTELLGQIRAIIKPRLSGAKPCVIVVAPDLRRRFRNFLASNNLNIPVLSPHEVSSDVSSYPLKLIKLENSAASTRSPPRRRA